MPRGIPLDGDRSASDVAGYPELHANDIDTETGIHHTLAALDERYASSSFNPLTEDLDADGHKVVHLADPTADQDAATKAYVDREVQGADGGASLDYATVAVTNPPTQAELVTLLGSPVTLGPGKLYHVNDGGAYGREYLVASDGLFFWVLPLVKARTTEPTGATASNAANYLTTPTYDGSGQATHPAVLDRGADRTWNGYRYWMALTPYPAGNDNYENPSMLVSHDLTTWEVPPGLTNPIEAQPGTGHNADAEIVWTTDGETMWLYFMWRNPTVASKLYARSSTDGVTWTEKVELLSGDDLVIASPSVLHDGTQYVMWLMDVSTPTPNTLKRYTCATPDGTWSAPDTCTVSGIPGGKDLWHIKMVKRGAMYHGFIVLCDAGVSGANSELWFATSPDGLAWTLTGKLLDNTASAWDSNSIYRASPVFAPEGYTLLYSADNGSNVWHIGKTTVTLS